jgi:hypothetical protein
MMDMKSIYDCHVVKILLSLYIFWISPRGRMVHVDGWMG